MVRLGLVIAAFALAFVLPARAETCLNGRGPGTRILVLAEGDSITFGAGSTDLRSYALRACLGSEIELRDTAISGATMGSPDSAPGANSLYGRLEADARLIYTQRASRPVVLTVLIGRNDLVGYRGGPTAYAEDLGRYIASMRAAGADRVVVATLLPSTWAPFQEPRAAFNAILRKAGWAAAHGIDVLADFAASPVMGPDAAAADRALYVDGTHPSDQGYDILAPIYREAVLKAMALTRP